MNQTLNTTTGVEISYYFICKRKLWLFAHNIQMEHTSEAVSIGSVLHETSYKRKRKEIQLGPIKIDFYEKNRGTIHEVKKSKAVEEAHIWQLKYYIYYLQNLGIEVKGSIDYPLIRRREEIDFTRDDSDELQEILGNINSIKDKQQPPPVINSTICKKCSYYELCYI